MSPSSRFSLGAYLRFVAAVAVVTGALLALGFLFTNGNGLTGREALLAACLTSAAASAVSGLPLALRGGDPQGGLKRYFLAMSARFFLLVPLAAWFVLKTDIPRNPYLLWLAGSYLALLVPDTAFALFGNRETSSARSL